VRVRTESIGYFNARSVPVAGKKPPIVLKSQVVLVLCLGFLHVPAGPAE
jgi:hypothetical protein